MTQNKFESSQLVVTRNGKKWLLRAIVVFILPFLLSACQPVAAGLSGVGLGIYIAIATIISIGFGLLLDSQNGLRLNSGINR